jgi:hypothetical protein
MDNKLNEIRRKIRLLRADMLSAEDNIRKRVNRDEDCSDAAVHLMSMRVVMLGLISERNRLGGEERLLNVDERLKLDVRAASRRPSNAAPDPGWRLARVSVGTEKARGRRER